MRLILGILLCLAVPARAEQLVANSHITDVTVYPAGARLTRLVEFSAGAGRHDLLIPDLPPGADPQLLRFGPGEGLHIGASALRHARLAPQELPKTAEYVAAEAALEQAGDAVLAALLARDAVLARVEAATAQIAYLRGLVGAEGGGDTAVLQATSRMIGAEVLAASEAALAARADLRPAEKALEAAQEAEAEARDLLASLAPVLDDRATLALSISLEKAGPARLEIVEFVGQARWTPLYDLSLNRTDGSLTLDRAFLVSQSTGEDWRDVALTLSTAQPGSSPVPGQLWPQRDRIGPPEEMLHRKEASLGAVADAAMEAPVVPFQTAVEFQGDIVNYRYPDPVNVADGVEDLRLVLDQLSFTPKLQALAIPRFDATAFLMAEFTNDSGQLLLPGLVALMRDGAFVGMMEMERLAPGADTKAGFGPIEGLRLERLDPRRNEGDSGVFSKSNRIDETAVMKVENLTDEPWDVRVMDLVPYSEQEDLEISYTAKPAPSETDVDGQRGILAWDLHLAPGAEQEITLNTHKSWPEGMLLNGRQF